MELLADVGQGARDQLTDIGEGLITLGLAGNPAILAQRVQGEGDPTVNARIEGFNQGVIQSVADPIGTAEHVGQSMSDTLEEEGLAYGLGYVGTDVVIGLATKKVAGGISGIVDDAGDTAGVVSKMDEFADTAEDVIRHVDGVEGGSTSINGLKVIDGKVDGKIPVTEYERYRVESVHNPNSDTMTLGKYEPTIRADGTKDFSIPGPGAYIVKAGDTTYFSLGTEWDNITDTYNLDKAGKNMFEYFNKPALDDAVKAGKKIRFSHNPEEYGECALKWEWDYLQEKHGYFALEKRGEFWYATK